MSEISYLPEIKEGTEFKINDHLSVRFEENLTKVYVKGKFFRQCINLLLNIPIVQVDTYEKVTSIDEAVDINKHMSLWENQVIDEAHNAKVQMEHHISPKEEFWGHCSNLQTWYEHTYDTRILYHNLAFPLLKALAEAGDPLAKKQFKDEVFQRFTSNYSSVILFVIEARILKPFTNEELSSLSDLLTDPKLKLLTKHYHFLYKDDPEFGYHVSGRIPFVKDIIDQFKKQNNLLTVQDLIKEHFLDFFFSDEVKDLSKYVKSDIMRRLLPHYHKKHDIKYDEQGYDVVISEALWINPIEKEIFDKEKYKHIYSLSERNTFKKIKIDGTVYYDFSLIEKDLSLEKIENGGLILYPSGWIRRAYIQYKDLWDAYRFLDKSSDCKLYIPDTSINDPSFVRMISEKEGYSIIINVDIITLETLKERRDIRRKRLYNRIKKRRSEKFKALCVEVYETQIDKEECKKSKCWGWSFMDDTCSCIYGEKFFSKMSSGLSSLCKQKKIFEKKNIFNFLTNRIFRVWKLKEPKEDVMDFYLRGITPNIERKKEV
ncbi:MAG: hypothetical protein ACFFCI_17840 [Promethearchaeota archaeon]